MRIVMLIAVAGVLASCTARELMPADLQSGTSCGYCRMTVLEPRLASQIVTAGEEPLFFDDLHCLTSYLRARDRIRPLGRVFVADHLTGDWVPAERAVYAIDGSRTTPMNSHLMAYRDEASRSADHAAGVVGALTVHDVFGEGVGDVLGR